MSRPSKLMQRRLDQVKKMTTKAVAAAMNAASEALDARLQEIAALKRILISERAQVIYYTDKYQKFTDGKCFDVVAIGFLSLPESEQEIFIKQAIKELSDNQGIVPHDQDAVEPQTEKKIILN
jgi:hypothetical protein